MEHSHDWEIKWYYNIANERIVTIPGYCLECKSTLPFERDIIEFLQMRSNPGCYSPNGALFMTGTLICPTCRIIAARLIIPIWYVPFEYLNKKSFTLEHLYEIYHPSQTQGHAFIPSSVPTTITVPFSLYLLWFMLYYGNFSLPIV